MERSRASYIPLPSLTSRGSTVESRDVEPISNKRSLRSYIPWKNLSILILILSNLCALIVLSSQTQIPSGIAITEPLPTKLVRFDWWTQYSSANDTETDRLWDDINPAHGMVAIDERHAEERQWPESMRLPTDGTKRVYLLEAYHLLHCLRIIRTTFWQLERGEALTYHPPHSGHCFDILRQSIQCHADNTLLYTLGKNTAGDQQLRQCRDWNSLRQWATDHTACYRDSVDQIPLNDHFGHCDDGDDGLIDAKRVG